MSTTTQTRVAIGVKLCAIRRAVAFAQSGRVGDPTYRKEEMDVGNAVYRAFGQPLIGQDTTPRTDMVRERLVRVVMRLSGVDWLQS